MSRATITDDQATAFVDESIRATDNGIYVVAAVVVLDDIGQARVAAEKVLPKKRRFHWRDEHIRQRHEMLSVLLDLVAC